MEDAFNQRANTTKLLSLKLSAEINKWENGVE